MITEQQKTATAYQYFTLEEWKLLRKCISHTYADLYGTKREIDQETVKKLLSKFPSVVL